MQSKSQIESSRVAENVPLSGPGKLRRKLSQYADCSPTAISNGSPAMNSYFISDAKHDIAALANALQNFTEGRDISYVDALEHARSILRSAA